MKQFLNYIVIIFLEYVKTTKTTAYRQESVISCQSKSRLKFHYVFLITHTFQTIIYLWRHSVSQQEYDIKEKIQNAVKLGCKGPFKK